MTDDYGASERIRELAKQPLLRLGAPYFDWPYAKAILEAQDRVRLADAIIANGGRSVTIRKGYDGMRMGYVATEDGAAVWIELGR